jgi:hypothetical protein
MNKNQSLVIVSEISTPLSWRQLKLNSNSTPWSGIAFKLSKVGVEIV